MLKAVFRKRFVFSMLLVLIMALAGCLLSPDPGESEPPEMRELFFDDFEDGLRDEWETFSLFTLPDTVDGKAVIANERTGVVVGLSDTNWTDYVIEVDLSVYGSVPAGGSFYNYPQIVFRVEGWSDFYVLAFSNTFVRLFERINGEFTGRLRSGDYLEGVALGVEPIRVRVEVKGNTIKVSVNGHECINYTDDDNLLTFGGAGIQGWNMPPGNVKWVFDNFVVYEIVEN